MDMEIDYTIPYSKIRERSLELSATEGWKWGPERIFTYIRKPESLTCEVTLINLNTLLQSNDLSMKLEEIQKRLYEYNNRLYKQKQGNKAELPIHYLKHEIKADFNPDIIFIDDDDDSTPSPAKILKSETSDESLDFIDTSLHSSFVKNEVFVPSPLEINNFYYIQTATSGRKTWIKAKLVKIILIDGKIHGEFHKISSKCKRTIRTIVDEKHVAYYDPPVGNLRVGSRIIAMHRGFKQTGEVYSKEGQFFLLGVVAERPNAENGHRYLIIFDNGCWLYVHPSLVRLIYQSDPEVWWDVPKLTRNIVKTYLEDVEKTKLDFAINTSSQIEYQGIVYRCDVMAVDASLVLVFISVLSKLEWVYRGSPRWVSGKNIPPKHRRHIKPKHRTD